MNRRTFLHSLATIATTAAFGLGIPVRREPEIREADFDSHGRLVGAEFEVGDLVFVTGFAPRREGYYARVVSRNPLTLLAAERPAQ